MVVVVVHGGGGSGDVWWWWCVVVTRTHIHTHMLTYPALVLGDLGHLLREDLLVTAQVALRLGQVRLSDRAGEGERKRTLRERERERGR